MLCGQQGECLLNHHHVGLDRHVEYGECEAEAGENGSRHEADGGEDECQRPDRGTTQAGRDGHRFVLPDVVAAILRPLGPALDEPLQSVQPVAPGGAGGLGGGRIGQALLLDRDRGLLARGAERDVQAGAVIDVEANRAPGL